MKTTEGSCSPEEFSENEVSRADEIAILSCVHEGMYDFVHRVGHEIAFNPPRESSANVLQNTVSYFTVLVELLCAG